MASIKKRPNGKWRARYRDAAGKEHARHFDRRVDAQRWLDEVTTSVVTGQYVDPKAGKETFRAYAERWRTIQVHRPSTQDSVERQLRRHVYPLIGDRPLARILPSDIQALRKRWDNDLAPATAAVVYRFVSTIFKAAVADRKIVTSPCASIKHVRPERAEVVPLTTEQVQALVEATPDRYRALVILAAGSGMRQGEIFGLTVDRVAFLRRTVRVDRQLTTVTGRAPTFGPTKNGKSRDVPLPQFVVDMLSEHLAAYPPGDDGLIFTNHAGNPLRRSNFGTMWRRVRADAGLDELVFHELRHYYASLLIRHGESVKTVQERLGHRSATETLDTYTHLWADSDDRTREAVDSVLGAAILADRVRTEDSGTA